MSTAKPPIEVSAAIRRLEIEYPDARIALNYSNTLELLVATILSAQCSDEMVNKVTSNLFNKYHTAEDYANADLERFEQEIRSAGFYRNKARNIIAAARSIVANFGGDVPRTMAELTTLPGVARKTANIVLYNAYAAIEGVAVDTHVRRVSRRLGLTQEKDPDKIEKDLMEQLPRDRWGSFPYLLIEHGRAVCTAKKPRCHVCLFNDICPSAFQV